MCHVQHVMLGHNIKCNSLSAFKQFMTHAVTKWVKVVTVEAAGRFEIYAILGRVKVRFSPMELTM